MSPLLALAFSLTLSVAGPVRPAGTARVGEDPPAVVAELVDALTAELAGAGWVVDSDLGPGAFAAWDKPVEGEPLRRLTLTPMELGDDLAAMARTVAGQIGGELLGEPEVATSPLLREVRLAVRMPGGGAAVFWMRGCELEGAGPVVLLSTLGLDGTPAGELRARADALGADLRPAFARLSNEVAARAVAADPRDPHAFELLGTRHRVPPPRGWSAVDRAGALRRWRGPGGATAALRVELTDSPFTPAAVRASGAMREAGDALAEALGEGVEPSPPTGSWDFPGNPRGGRTAGRFATRDGLALVLEVVAPELPAEADAAEAAWAPVGALLAAWTHE